MNSDVRKPISIRFRFSKTRTEPQPKCQTRNFRFRGFSPNLSHTNSQYLSHSHKALTFFTLRTLLDSKRSWNQIISRHHAIIHAFETNWAFRKPSTKMQNAYTRKTAYTFFVFYNWSTKKTEPNRRFFSKPNQNQTWKSIPHIPTHEL